MKIIASLLKVWVKTWLRQQNILSMAQTPGILWGGVIRLALPVGIAAYASVHFLGEWWKSPQTANSLVWYLSIAWSFLSIASLLRFIPLLSSRAEALFLSTVPFGRGRFYIARLVYSMLFNLVLFLAVSLPPLIAIGVWERGGLIYFTVLLAVAVAISLAAALMGGILAVLTVFFVRFLPWRKRNRLRLPPMFQSAEVMSGLYLLVTVVLSRILSLDILAPPVSLAGWLFARPLAMAAEGAPLSLWAMLGPMVGLTILIGLFLVVYTGIFPALPFEKRTTSRKRIRSVQVRFCRHPLLKRDLANGWLAPIGMALYAGITVAVLAYILPPIYMMSVPPVMMTTFLLAAISFSAVIGNADSPLSDLRIFFLMRVSPLSLFTFMLIRVLVSFGKALTGGLIATLIFAVALYLTGQAWKEALFSLPVLFACLVFPVTAGMEALSFIGLNPNPENASTNSITILIGWLLITAGGIVASLYILFPIPAQPFGQALRLVAVALSLSVGCVVGVYFLLRLASRRLSRIEWL